MRVLLVHPGPTFSVADVYNGLVKGFVECGVEVATSNLDDRLDAFTSAEITRDGVRRMMFSRDGAVKVASKTLFQDLYQFWPHVVVFTSGFFITPEVWATLTRRPCHTVAWFTESPYEDEKQINVARYVDTAIVNDPANLDLFRTANPRTWYFPHSYDPDIHKPGPVDQKYKCDFGWCGTSFPSRLDFFNQVDWSGIDVKLAGCWLNLDRRTRLAKYLIHPKDVCLDNVETVRLYQSAKMSANIYRREASDTEPTPGWSIGPREVELAATGCFMLRESRPEGDELFPKAPVFTEPGEFGDLIRWWSAHDDQRREVARLNRDAIADRTFKNTAARLLGLVDGAPKRVL